MFLMFLCTQTGVSPYKVTPTTHLSHSGHYCQIKWNTNHKITKKIYENYECNSHKEENHQAVAGIIDIEPGTLKSKTLNIALSVFCTCHTFIHAMLAYPICTFA